MVRKRIEKHVKLPRKMAGVEKGKITCIRKKNKKQKRKKNYIKNMQKITTKTPEKHTEKAPKKAQKTHKNERK
jgi:hypothetical protein